MPPIIQCRAATCSEKATWDVVDGSGPDDHTYACHEHVGPMLRSDRKAVLTPMRQEDAAPGPFSERSRAFMEAAAMVRAACICPSGAVDSTCQAHELAAKLEAAAKE